MRFVYPEFLWALLLLSIPIIIHLFSFRRYKTLYFSSLSFLKFVDQQTKSTQKLKHLLVLISRILALSSLIIAFAQPYIPVAKNELGGKSVIAIYIDNSFSMTAKGTEGELLSEAREFARKTINNASLETAFLIHTNALNGIEKRLITKPEALDFIEQIKPSPINRKIEDIIQWQNSTLTIERQNGKKIASQQHVLLSDYQKHNTIFNQKINDSINYFYPIQFIPQVKSNLYIDSIWFENPFHQINENNELNVRVINESNTDLVNVEMEFNVNNMKRSYFLDLAANQKTITKIQYTDTKPGQKKGHLSINDKQLFWDDDFFFNYDISSKSKILIINGENASNSIEKIFSLEPYFEVNVISYKSFNAEYLKNTNLVMLNEIDEITNGLTEKMDDFSKNGGSIAIIPSKNINKNGNNLLLSKLELPILGQLNNNTPRLKSIQYDDVFFRGMFDKKSTDLNSQIVKKSYHINTTNQSNYFKLIEFQNDQPLLVRSNGQHSTNYLFCTSLSNEYSSLTSSSLFPPLILRIGELSQRKTPLYVTIGKESIFPLFNVNINETPIHLLSNKIDFIPKLIKNDAVSSIQLSGNEASENLIAEIYAIQNEGKSIGNISLNYSREESSTKYSDLNEIENTFLNSGIKNISTSKIEYGQSLSKIDIDKPFEYWKIFIILAGIFLLIEMVLLKFWK